MVTRSKDYYKPACEACTKQALFTSVITKFFPNNFALFKPRYAVQLIKSLHRGVLSKPELVQDPMKWMRAPPAQSREYY